MSSDNKQMVEELLAHARNAALQAIVGPSIEQCISNNDFFSALMIWIISQPRVPRVNKLSILRRLTDIEWEMNEIADVLKPNANKDEFTAEMMKEHESLINNIEKTFSKLEGLEKNLYDRLEEKT